MPGRFAIDTIFRAVDRFTRPVAKMGTVASRFGRDVSRGVRDLDKGLDKVHGTLKKVGTAALVTGAAVGAAVVDIVRTGAEFDKTLVGAAAKFDPAMKRGTAGFERLRMAAESFGETTEFNAQQGAEALKALASAGFDVEQSIAALPGIGELATAAEVDLGTAAEMATKSLGAFGLKVDDAAQLSLNLARVTDVMATAAGKTEASMEGLFESIKQGGPVAVTTGASMETFMAQAAALASAGIEGSVAGTTLKDTYLALAAPTKKAAAMLKHLKISTKDSNGNLRDTIDIFRELEKATAKMGTGDRAHVLERIFGKIPIAGVSKLLDIGADKVAALRAQLEGAGGATAKMANAMRDTVAGDLDEFTSAIDGVKISLFSLNNEAIRDVIQGMTEWVRVNKDDILSNIQVAVIGLRDNLPEIVERLKQVGKAVVAFYAMKTAVSVADTAIRTFQLGMSIAKGTIDAATWSMKEYRKVSETASGKFGDARQMLNASALGQSINGVTSKLGKAGLLGAALAVGYAFGTWLDHEFGISKMLESWLEEVTGINKELDKAGGRASHRGVRTGDQHYYADGTVTDAAGKMLKKGTEWESHQAGAREFNAFGASFDKPKFGDFRDDFNPDMSVAGAAPAAPQFTSTHNVDEQKMEITIRDESGSAEVTKKPRAANVTLKLHPSGLF